MGSSESTHARTGSALSPEETKREAEWNRAVACSQVLRPEVIKRFKPGPFLASRDGTQISSTDELDSPTVGAVKRGEKIDVDNVCKVQDRLRGHLADGRGWVSLACPSMGWVWAVPVPSFDLFLAQPDGEHLR